MAGLTLDSGALIAFERVDRRVMLRIEDGLVKEVTTFDAKLLEVFGQPATWTQG